MMTAKTVHNDENKKVHNDDNKILHNDDNKYCASMII